MDYNEKVEGLVNEIFETIERAVDQTTRIDLDLPEFAENNEFRISDIKDEDVLAMISPLLRDLVLGYLESAREYEEE
jgi:hypothetical protein